MAGLPAVVTLTVQIARDENGKLCTNDKVEATEALRKLEKAGADVVGFNCSRGPDTILPLLEDAKKAGIKVPLAVLPVPYRTTQEQPTFMTLTDTKTGKLCFPVDLDCHLCTRNDIVKFGKRCAELGIPYVGLCCGNSPHYTRSLAESLGRKPEATRYSPNMSLHVIYGADEKLNAYERESAANNNNR
ncbi:S-methylmethionine--homocysteine S-methyltransferase BHMT2-like [Strongylocentrotus purpuratus]|uniref:Hcy-binding domain-containing protein n=1 Tax=Strongylocentrotus purpuratus TaxID=7668 RepID=A0A7M7N0K9_STRPU|nr:S-methylmethionine--homocysteine S-methyltransferase BHMT2-like [Strongylocentrotus purpuratus]